MTAATIDPSSSSPPIPLRSASRRGPHAPSPNQSTPQSASRRSNISSQIYQFALGYPQTPPETSPVCESIGPFLQAEEQIAVEKMGSFLFKWYARAATVYQFTLKYSESLCHTPGWNAGNQGSLFSRLLSTRFMVANLYCHTQGTFCA